MTGNKLKKEMLKLNISYKSKEILEEISDKNFLEAIEYSLTLLNKKKNKGSTKYLFKDNGCYTESNIDFDFITEEKKEERKEKKVVKSPVKDKKEEEEILINSSELKDEVTSVKDIILQKTNNEDGDDTKETTTKMIDISEF